MNREIKFKVWDKKTKEFVANGEPMDLYYSAHVNAFMFDNDNYDLHKEIVLCQFTGLNDKNGKEIYEGDILSISSPPPYDHPILYVVVFNETASFRRRYIDRYKGNEGSFYDEDLTIGEHPVFEVIGNIYENPDLLTS